MAYNPLADVNITLATASFEVVGFGLPLFITSTNAFPERARAYGSLDEVSEDFPTTSAAYAAATSAFSAGNGLSSLLIGRRDSDAVLSVDHVPVTSEVFELTVEVNDGDKISIVYTEATATPAQEDVLTGIAALINADTQITDHITAVVTGTGDSAKLTLSAKTTADILLLSDVDNLVDTYVSTETAAEVYQEIKEENDSFYAITAEDKSEAFVLALSTAVNADDKQYWVTTSEQASLTPLVNPATDLLGKLYESNAARTVGIYHQNAETTFPELQILAYNLVYPSGSIVWGNNAIGIASVDTTTGRYLKTSQKTNLLARRAAFWDRQGGQVFFNSDVFTMSGERPENVRGRDNMVADMVTDLSSFMLQQNGNKITYNDRGIAQIESKVDAVLARYVQRNFIEEGYVITVPLANTISAAQKQSQIFDQLTFVAQLTGAITMTEIRGTLQLDEVVA